MRILWHLARLGTLVFLVGAIGHGLINYIDRLGSANGRSGVPLHAVTRHHGCQRHRELPDPACTPGARLPDVGLAQICRRGYTRTVRTGLTQDTKRAVYAAYGQPHRYNGASGELDHLVPLEAGGSNDPANLWPQPAPASHNKDLVENYENAMACRHRIPLATAQREIATDWTAVYRRVGPNVLAAYQR